MIRAKRQVQTTAVGENKDEPAAAASATRHYSNQNMPKKDLPVEERNLIPEGTAEPLDAEPKVEPTDDAMNMEEDTMNMEENDEDGVTQKKKGKLFFKKIFASRKKSSVRTKEKKLRQNRQLRKVILPKNALMALNEVKGINVGDFVINANAGGGFTAIVCVNGNQYEGKGPSKIIAKNKACEYALRDYVLAKMRQNPRRGSRPASIADDTPMETEENGEAHDEDDEVPMVNLTSFALYKLFIEWEKEGYEIPEFHPQNQLNANDSDGGGSSVGPKEPKKPQMRNDLPPNWQTMHPATLLCLMRPGLTYSDLGVEGEKPNTIQKLRIVVDDMEFMGRGRNKKAARRNTAAMVCNRLFKTKFEVEKI